MSTTSIDDVKLDDVKSWSRSLSAAVRHAIAADMHDYFTHTGKHIKPDAPAVAPAALPPTRPLQRPIPTGLSRTESQLWEFDKDDHDFRHAYLKGVPDFIAGYFGKRYQHIYEKEGRRRANTFLRETMGKKVSARLQLVMRNYRTAPENLRFNASYGADDPFQDSCRTTNLTIESIKPAAAAVTLLAEMSRDQIDKLAEKTADGLFGELTRYFEIITGKCADADDLEIMTGVYKHMAELTHSLGVDVPYWENYRKGKLTVPRCESALLRMTCKKWWTRKLRTMGARMYEHMAIAAGQVQKAASPYVSRRCLRDWHEQKKRNAEMIKAMALRNKETGEEVPLADSVYASVANPAIRRCELMTRMRGFEDIANNEGLEGDFYTLTAPSAYHSTHINGGFNEKWNGSNPRDTQKYLCGVWAKARAKLNRDGIRVFGFRVAEPHHDGTPHWHMLLFFRPENREAIRSVLREYALQEDGDEAGAEFARFKAKEIDPALGSATGYIAKYISKNIDGYALDGEKDDETGEDLKESSKSVTAWASRWRIRQFQQIGGAPVTVWRELRRLRDQKFEHKDMDAVLAAADVGCWATYTNAQGGPLVNRSSLVIRLAYKKRDELNAYEEPVEVVAGVYSPWHSQLPVIDTRPIEWEIVPRSNKQDAAPAASALALSGCEAPPRSSVNNCTGRAHGIDDNTGSGVAERLITELKARGFGMWGSSNGLRSPDFDTQSLRETAELLLRGCRFNAGSGMSLHLQNGRLVETENFT